jgi:hypothetical protein
VFKTSFSGNSEVIEGIKFTKVGRLLKIHSKEDNVCYFLARVPHSSSQAKPYKRCIVLYWLGKKKAFLLVLGQ